MSIESTTIRRRFRSGLLSAAACVLALLALTATGATAKPGGAAGKRHAFIKPTIVLVHGAWADGSGWSGVIERLQADGYEAIAPANPLRSLSGDSAYLAGVLAQIPGPLVVVAHSYGGAVVTNAAAGNANVKALVYIDAFLPDVGENVLDLAGAGSLVGSSIVFRGYPPFGPTDGEAYITKEAFHETFAADVPAKQSAVLWAAQRPAAGATTGEPTTATAWKTIPSWALVGLEDRTITPEAQLFMARRAGAKITKIHSSHVAMISHPGAVTKLIEQAVKATAK
jgi:pimeloyl-ACP methyl ester carboxylesterase